MASGGRGSTNDNVTGVAGGALSELEAQAQAQQRTSRGPRRQTNHIKEKGAKTGLRYNHRLYKPAAAVIQIMYLRSGGPLAVRGETTTGRSKGL